MEIICNNNIIYQYEYNTEYLQLKSQIIYINTRIYIIYII